MNRFFISSSLLLHSLFAFTLFSCGGKPGKTVDGHALDATVIDSSGPREPIGPVGPNTPTSTGNGTETGAGDNTCTKESSTFEYKGLGGISLKAGRQTGNSVKENRVRIKNLLVLLSSYKQAFDFKPTSISKYTNILELGNSRYSVEPIPSDSTNIAYFSLGYEVGKNVIISDKSGSWVKRSTPAQIREGCISFATKAWLRTPSEEAILECAGLVSATGPFKSSTLEERWALAMASILSSLNFVAY